MRGDVFFEFGICNKTTVALSTVKDFLVVVPFHVYGQAAGLSEALVANVADVRTFSCVRSSVDYKGTRTVEA